ncbi:unnamed protein product [Effrenium voratum]|uniref:Adenylate kinase n=1 Tax=Effrenium voratum TaxID=2562239 RepID=A0AA36N3G4_9DINO|nr:unnamed protein product [Effrenium voratum]
MDKRPVAGRTLASPVAADWKPDLKGNLHEITEYLEEQGAYDLFDLLLKDLMIKQPADPLQHMLDCLEKGHPDGPLKVIVSSPPGICREEIARSLAERLGLIYIGAGELLREAGVKTRDLSFAEDTEVSKLVLELVKQAEHKMQGFVIDGFPRTACQTTFLKEKAIVPTHVLLLQASEDFILQREKGIADGQITGETTPPEVLAARLKLFTGHNSLALADYADRTFVINAQLQKADVLAKMAEALRLRPRSKAPAPPPRVAIVGAGQAAANLASRLAARIGAVFVGSNNLRKDLVTAGSANSCVSLDVARAAEKDPLGVVGARLRQVDCSREGWVVANFPETSQEAEVLHQDEKLVPLRVVAMRSPDLQEHQPGILQALRGPGISRCLEVEAEDSEEVFKSIVEFVERPLPRPEM